jgi:hypothetical protein
MTKRRRGAPRGNHNALKHGFYSAAFKQAERQLLLRLPATDLSPELELVRVHLLRFLDALKDSSVQLNVQTRLAALRAVNLSVQSILALVRAREADSIVNHTDLLTLLPRLAPPQEPPPFSAPELVSPGSSGQLGESATPSSDARAASAPALPAASDADQQSTI